MFSHLHQAHHLHHVVPRGAKAHEDRRKTTGGGSQLVHATNLPHAANDLAGGNSIRHNPPESFAKSRRHNGNTMEASWDSKENGEFTSSGSSRDPKNEPNVKMCWFLEHHRTRFYFHKFAKISLFSCRLRPVWDWQMIQTVSFLPQRWCSKLDVGQFSWEATRLKTTQALVAFGWALDSPAAMVSTGKDIHTIHCESPLVLNGIWKFPQHPKICSTFHYVVYHHVSLILELGTPFTNPSWRREQSNTDMTVQNPQYIVYRCVSKNQNYSSEHHQNMHVAHFKRWSWDTPKPW